MLVPGLAQAFAADGQVRPLERAVFSRTFARWALAERQAAVVVDVEEGSVSAQSAVSLGLQTIVVIPAIATTGCVAVLYADSERLLEIDPQLERVMPRLAELLGRALVDSCPAMPADAAF